MNNFKNLLIATLTGLLALSLFTQPAQGEGPVPYVKPIKYSQTAKAIQYDHCLRMATAVYSNSYLLLDSPIRDCAKYRP
jgi:hypothetical protein